MLFRKKAFLAVLLFAQVFARAFNPIHDAGYSGLESTYLAHQIGVEFGFLAANGGDGIGIPAALRFGIARNLELGAGVKTFWGEGGNPFRQVVLGLKFRGSTSSAFGLDLSIGLEDGHSTGLRVSGLTHVGHGGMLSSRISGKLGFLEGLKSEDALMALEGAWYPTLSFSRGLSLESGLILSSQTKNFNDYFALDIQPGLRVGLGRGEGLLVAVAFGLAGPHREDMRVQVALELDL